MSRPPVAWVLNLDAEEELAARGAFTPSRALSRIVTRERVRLVGSLVQPDDLVLERDASGRPRARLARSLAMSASGAGLADENANENADGWSRAHELAESGELRGLAWSPTPSARALLASFGFELAGSPNPGASGALVEPGVLRQVNARPFTAALLARLDGPSLSKHVASSLDEALSHLARPCTNGWLVRRSFGAAGRGRRRIASGAPDAGELAWLRAGLRTGPLVLEPWVHVTREYTRSGYVTSAGHVEIAAPCFQATTREGAWLGTEGAHPDEVSRADDERLAHTAAEVGAALAAAGYAGPFGIDAFRHRRLDGAGDVLHPLSEINARFTMDWTVGMARAGDALGELPAARTRILAEPASASRERSD